jgi:hypothetical protein
MSEANAGTKTQSAPNTRTVCDSLLAQIESLKSQLATITLEEKVEIGSVLWAVGDAISDTLNGVKKDLRVEGTTQLGGASGVTAFEGTDLGTASVTIPKASLRVPKGKDMDTIKTAIGSDFALFFEEVTTYKPRAEFDKRVPTINNPLHQQILLNSVERVEPTPRVSFRRNTPPKAQAKPKAATSAASGSDVADLLDE